MLLLGIDIGTSFIKATVVDGETRKVLASARYPETEAIVHAPQPGWAEQHPDQWWHDTQIAIKQLTASGSFDALDIGAIGISYQMHGLVMIDKHGAVIRPSIIWCDSRAVSIGDKAFDAIGHDYCLQHLLNTPGNFTASKLAWVKQHEPTHYEQCYKIMLPGDYIAYKLTGQITTSASGLSEGILWDFKQGGVSQKLLDYFGFDKSIIPDIKNVFDNHGQLRNDVAQALGLKPGIPVAYKAGDQPNNAFSLNVTQPGEIAATAGTSGVVYGVTDSIITDTQGRVNSFAHVNHTQDTQRIGVLLCINGAGSANSWVKHNIGSGRSYDEMNAMAAAIPLGSEGVQVLPFGNGAERMLHNKVVGAHFTGFDFNRHTQAHIYRAVQEGIAFAMVYGINIMRTMGMNPAVIRAGHSNMFLSTVFTEILVNTSNIPVEIYNTDGAQGAALGAGYGIGYYHTATEAVNKTEKLYTITPDHKKHNELLAHYEAWKEKLETLLSR